MKRRNALPAGKGNTNPLTGDAWTTQDLNLSMQRVKNKVVCGGGMTTVKRFRTEAGDKVISQLEKSPGTNQTWDGDSSSYMSFEAFQAKQHAAGRTCPEHASCLLNTTTAPHAVEHAARADNGRFSLRQALRTGQILFRPALLP